MAREQWWTSLGLASALAMVFIQPAQAQVAQITGVQLNPTREGLEVLLETTAGASTLVQSSQSGSRWIAEINNAQLTLPQGGFFRQDNPTAQITSVTVQTLDGNRVQIVVAGNGAAPTGQVFLREGQGLVAALNTSLTEEPKSAPASEATQDLAPIELVVTATRTEEPVAKVPRSLTVINREQIEEQAQLSRDLGDILTKTVPGFSPPNNRTNTFGLTLRGRRISVLIDGIPQNTNLQSIPAELTSIDPAAVERIEVLRSPNAIYGGQATGGVINIITRKPTGAGFQASTEVGFSNSLTHLDDSFGYTLQQSVSSRQDNADFIGTFAWTGTSGFFDAEGDRIANFAGAEDSTALELLGKFGLDIDEQQRLQFTFNRYDRQQDSDFFSDPAIDEIEGIQKARARRLPAGTRFIGVSQARVLQTTNATLQYTHKKLLGSEAQGQLFFRDYNFGGGIPDDLRDFFGFIATSPGESQQWGGRFQVDTPFNPDRTMSLLWGIDYIREKSSQTFNIFDPEDFDTSGGRLFRKIGEIPFVPDYRYSDLGVFAQLQWDVTDRLRLAGGVRYVNIGLDVEDYTTFDGRFIQGGERNFGTPVFNIGGVYDLSNNVNVYANFAQGFSVPDLGRVFRNSPRGFVEVESGIQLTEPQKVDNYEIGIRGNWNPVQASLVGFYNYSDLGSTIRARTDGGPLETIRAPQRVYGIEAGVDIQPVPGWQLGGTFTWLEGENDADLDDEFLPLNSLEIPPLKLTAYVENETLPGWRNRLQLLYSGSRDRAFEEGVDGQSISSYVVVDWLSSIKLGPGALQVGIENLFNNQYFPVYSQYFASFFDSANYAGRGRTLSVGYRVNW